MTNPESDASKRRRSPILLGGALVLVLIVVGGVLWWLNRDVPEEASVEAALAAITDTTAANGTDDTTPVVVSDDTAPDDATSDSVAGSGDVGLDGTWTVDTTVGDFSFEEATATFVGFRVEEVLNSIGSTTAVGRTPEVSGSMEIEGSTITAVAVEANMGAIITNDSRRDSRAKGAIRTDEFPIGTFTLTEPIDLGSLPAVGELIAANAVGELTIAGVTSVVEFAIEAQLADNGLIVVAGKTNVLFSDFDVTAPSAPIVASVEDNAVVEIQIWFSQG